jgi:hypothetical protein
LEFHGADANDWLKGTFSLRENTTPRQLEGVVTDAASAQYIGKVVHVIYKIEGGTLHADRKRAGQSGSAAELQRPRLAHDSFHKEAVTHPAIRPIAGSSRSA